jgi:predicted oxidoreductase
MNLSTIVAGAMHMARWNLSAAERLSWIEDALALGITSFDHADIYGDYAVQGLFGEALRLQPGLRQQMQLVSKCGIALHSSQRPEHSLKHYNTTAQHIQSSVERSLQALGTDRLDLLLIHRPDPLLEADEVARCVEELQRAGKVLDFGVSNHSVQQFELLDSRILLATNQIELSPLHTAALLDGTLDQAQRLRRRPMVWSPLAGGRLFTDTSAQTTRTRTALQAVADEHGVNLATAAYAWVLRHPSRPHLVTGTGRRAGLQEAVTATQLHLNVQQWTRIWSASMGHEVP